MALTPEEKAAAQAAKEKAAVEKKAAADEKKAAAKLEKDRIAAEKKVAAAEKAAAAKVKAPVVSQNGITRPNRGVTLKVWQTADRISGEKGKPAERKEVVEACMAEVTEIGTIHTQYGRWRKFHGLTSQRVVNAEAAAAAGAAGGAAE